MALQLKDEQIAQAILASRHTYNLDVPGLGIFTCHVSTFRDEADVMAYQTNYLLNRQVNPSTASTQLLYYGYLIGMVCTLCDKAPPGFVPEAQPREVIEDLVNRMLDYEGTFRNPSDGTDGVVKAEPAPDSPVVSLPAI